MGPLKQGDLPLAMLNSLQHQAYKINPLIFAVAEHCYESFTSVGKFRRDAPMPIPENRLEKDSDKESVDTYKRARTNAENFNAQLAQKNWRTTEVMFVARKYVNEKAMWLSASFDYRGRVYFQSTFNPQGSDFDKSLFYFADEGPINRYWMAIDLATKYGLDKETMANRVKWTEDNQSLISEIATACREWDRRQSH